MSVGRTGLVVGPAKLVHRGATLFTKDDFEVNTSVDTFNINTSPHGKVDERAIEAKAECSFTPEGRYAAALIGALWSPFANMKIGTSLVGYTATINGTTGAATITAVNSSTDEPLVISAADGQVHTIIAAAVTKPPDILLSATKTMIGQATISGVRQNGKAWTDADSLYTIGSADGDTNIADSTFAPSSIRTQPYTAIWTGISGFDTAFESEDGFTVSWDVKTTDMKTDTSGVVDIRLTEIAVMVKCVPIGPTAAQIQAALKYQGSGSARGHSLAGVGAQLQITGADSTNYVTIPTASLKTAGYRFGSTALRNREIGFVAARTFSGGAQQPLFTLGAP